MSRVEVVTGYHVHVEPSALGDGGWIIVSDGIVQPAEKLRLQHYERTCEHIAQQILRHVDDVASAAVKAAAEAHCSFCGRTWTEPAYSPHNGGCCDLDAANVPPEDDDEPPGIEETLRGLMANHGLGAVVSGLAAVAAQNEGGQWVEELQALARRCL